MTPMSTPVVNPVPMGGNPTPVIEKKSEPEKKGETIPAKPKKDVDA
jgi:hypothetical protein